MTGKLKIKYVQLEPAEYPADADWLTMGPAERGIYHSLIIYLLTNDGKLELNIEKLCKISNAERNVFELFWKKYAHKFQHKNNQIKHKRVSKVLRAARKLIIQRSLAGKASANARSTGVKIPFNEKINPRSTNETKRNRKRIESNTSNSKRNSTSIKNSLSASNSLRFIDALETIISPRNQSDRTANRNLLTWIETNILENRFNVDIYKRILDYAAEAKQNARNPPAMFYSILQRELGYRKKKS